MENFVSIVYNFIVRVHILDDKWKVPDISEEMGKTIACDVLLRLR